MKNIRLKAIYDLLQGESAIDIGTDHGYLLVYLAKSGYDKLLGVEVVQGPYENFRSNIRKNNLEDKIDTLMSSGLNKLSLSETKEYNNIIIAGMGGDLITKIISDDLDKFKYSYLVLQPNNNEYKLRKYLNENKFEILDENIIEDNSKIYEIILCKYSVGSIRELTEKEKLFGGEKLYAKEEFKKKWYSEQIYLEKIINQIKENRKEIPKELENKLELIKEIRS